MNEPIKKPKPKSPYSAYKKIDVMTANKETILLMMYQGAIRFLKQGIDSIKNDRRDESREQISRALDIVNELRSTLNFKVGGEIADKLEGLYGFVIERIVTGNIHSKVEPLEEALGILSTLYTAWDEAISSLKKEGTPTP